MTASGCVQHHNATTILRETPNSCTVSTTQAERLIAQVVAAVEELCHPPHSRTTQVMPRVWWPGRHKLHCVPALPLQASLTWPVSLWCVCPTCCSQGMNDPLLPFRRATPKQPLVQGPIAQVYLPQQALFLLPSGLPVHVPRGVVFRCQDMRRAGRAQGAARGHQVITQRRSRTPNRRHSAAPPNTSKQRPTGTAWPRSRHCRGCAHTVLPALCLLCPAVASPKHLSDCHGCCTVVPCCTSLPRRHNTRGLAPNIQPC